MDRVRGSISWLPQSLCVTTLGLVFGYFEDYGYTTFIPQSMKELWAQISDVGT